MGLERVPPRGNLCSAPSSYLQTEAPKSCAYPSYIMSLSCALPSVSFPLRESTELHSPSSSTDVSNRNISASTILHPISTISASTTRLRQHLRLFKTESVYFVITSALVLPRFEQLNFYITFSLFSLATNYFFLLLFSLSPARRVHNLSKNLQTFSAFRSTTRLLSFAVTSVL